MDLPFDPDSVEILEDCLASTVYRAKPSTDDAPYQWVVIKRGSTSGKICREPHDILKESKLLAEMRHDNIVAFLGSHTSRQTGQHEFWMPFIPMSLQTLMSSPYFSPFAMPSATDPYDKSTSFRPGMELAQFDILAKSIIYQTLSALAYLHDSLIAHRDIKPSNVLLTESGCVKLIDFGIAYSDRFTNANDIVWPEPADRMYCEVATGSYRAPELLFAPSQYDACATDLWSLGITIANCFTPLQKAFDDDDDDDEENEDDRAVDPLEPFIVPKLKFPYGSMLRPSRWIRRPLLNADRGELGLIWSIFSTFGTPTRDNWPTFEELPHAGKINFKVVPRINLEPLLPNLPLALDNHPLDLLHKLLVYPPTERLRAADALNHPWFASTLLLLPADCHPTPTESLDVVEVWEGKGLGTWLRATMAGASDV